jgi:poly(A) polymerase/tRNA nucleotidyltransferase (CCA-adding enzyme)
MKKIPDYLLEILAKLETAGFEAFLVGGCVRDILRGEEPKDYDIATIARPEQLLTVFPEAKYENDFGTVIYPIKKEDGSVLDVVEITTYRSEQGYSDRRHPDEVRFETELDKDLERRDFTINAMALRFRDGQEEIIDLFGGQKDISKRIIRAVGEPNDRFKEDALRMLRAIRFSAELGFAIEEKTERAISKLAGSIKFVANERIRDELIKIISSSQPFEGLMKLYKLKLLQYIIPELLLGDGLKQNHHHIYAVLKHNLLSLKFCQNSDWRVRMAALLHDVGKPEAYKELGGQATFYNHEYIGERLVKKIMRRLKFANVDIEKVALLVRNHMFYYVAEEVTAASVRRLIKKVGRENLKDLMDIRIADRLGSGTPKAKPYKLRHLEYMFDKVQNDPVSVKMLAINGDYLIKELGFSPGPKMGAVLDCLLSEVIEEVERNNLEYLVKRAKELYTEDVEALREKAKEVIEEKREEDDRKIKGAHHVK